MVDTALDELDPGPDDEMVDIGATAPRKVRRLIRRAAKVQGVHVTIIVRMCLKHAEPFLMSLAFPEGTDRQKETNVA